MSTEYMQNKENKIDDLFKSRLANYKASPSPAVWDKISASMVAKRRRKAAIWILSISTAAALALAFIMGWHIADQSEYHSPSMASTMNQSSKQPNHTILSSPIKQNITICFEKPQFNALAKSFHAENRKETDNQSFIKRQSENLKQLTSIDASAAYSTAFNTNLASINYDAFSDFDRKIIEANLMAMNSDANQDAQSRWSIGVQASPVYRFDQTSGNSSIEANEDYGMSQSGSTSYQANLSGGLKLAYKASKKWALETGVHYSEIDQNASDISLAYMGQSMQYQMDNMPSYNGIEANSINAENNVIVNTPVGWSSLNIPTEIPISSTKLLAASIPVVTNDYNLSQKAGYVEIPFLIHYSLIDKRVGIHLSGGLNTNVLVSNNVSLNTQNKTIANGKTEGLRPLIFSSSLGVGMNYAISKRFFLNFEPTLKIQLNSLNAQSGFDARPYAIGLFSGVSYQF